MLNNYLKIAWGTLWKHKAFSAINLTEELAERFFGVENVVGRVLMRKNGDPCVVTALMRDPPAASHLQFEALVSFATLQVFETRNAGTFGMYDWNSFSSTYTYLLLSEEAVPADLRITNPQIGTGKPIEKLEVRVEKEPIMSC